MNGEVHPGTRHLKHGEGSARSGEGLGWSHHGHDYITVHRMNVAKCLMAQGKRAGVHVTNKYSSVIPIRWQRRVVVTNGSDVWWRRIKKSDSVNKTIALEGAALKTGAMTALRGGTSVSLATASLYMPGTATSAEGVSENEDSST